MRPAHSPPPASRGALRTGAVLSALAALFLLFDGAMKLVKPAPVVEATVQLGFSEGVIVPLGIVLLVCTALYLLAPTAVLGAILLTGYLGGAVATHVGGRRRRAAPRAGLGRPGRAAARRAVRRRTTAPRARHRRRR